MGKFFACRVRVVAFNVQFAPPPPPIPPIYMYTLLLRSVLLLCYIIMKDVNFWDAIYRLLLM